ncbi:MAG: hypothetical protein A3F18_06535 [Legionellales bacterium RIFCSPHIGHO2_12_FULL_37_14]|nr:MAG: hypothetical protein A3F18_06535 [Legionellales bacterium RIFCSPHIGHO2_12_FULL_37_14]
MPDYDLLIRSFGLTVSDNAPVEEKVAVLQALIDLKTNEAANNKAVRKIKRKNEHDCSILRFTNDAGDYETYLVATKNQYLGEGTYGRTKLAIRIDPPDPLLSLYAVKREWDEDNQQVREAETLKKFGLLCGKSFRYSSTTKKAPPWWTHKKYYTFMPYLGTELAKVLKDGQLTEDEKLDLSIQIAMEVHKLHTKGKYAHRDLKPANILVEKLSNGRYKAHLIDFGFARPVSFPFTPQFLGSYGYLPVVYSPNELKRKRAKFEECMQNLGSHTAVDVFALKRTLSKSFVAPKQLIDAQGLYSLNQVLAEMINTNVDEEATKKKHTAAMLAANLILHSLSIYPPCVLSDEDSKKIIEIYEDSLIKDKITAMRAITSGKIANAAALILKYLKFVPTDVIIDEEFANKILEIEQEPIDDRENKLSQILFLKESFGQLISPQKLKVNFYFPLKNSIPDPIQVKNLGTAILQDFTNDIGCNPTQLIYNLDKMLEVVCSSQESWKRDAKLLLTYFHLYDEYMPFSLKNECDHILASQQECERMLDFFKSLTSKSNKDDDYSLQYNQLKNYLIYTENAHKMHIDIDYAVFANTDFTDLILCYESYDNEERKNNIKFIQMTHLMFTHEFIEYKNIAKLSNKTIADLTEICKSLKVNQLPNPPANGKNPELNEEQKKLLEDLTKPWQKDRLLSECKKKCDVSLLLKDENLTDTVLADLKNLLEYPPLKGRQGKAILASFGLEGVFPDEDVEKYNQIILSLYSYNNKEEYAEKRLIVAANLFDLYIDIGYSADSEATINKKKAILLYVCELYKQILPSDRPSFRQIAEAVKKLLDDPWRKELPNNKEIEKLIEEEKNLFVSNNSKKLI